MKICSTGNTSVIPSRISCLLAAALFVAIAAAQIPVTKGRPQAASKKAIRTSLVSGVVVDSSGAVLAGATVRVLRADNALQRTLHADKSGSFSIEGLPEGPYRLTVSSPGFSLQETSIFVRAGQAFRPLRITLEPASISTVEVDGREDDLSSIADFGTQGTAGAKEIEDRPILRSGELLA